MFWKKRNDNSQAGVVNRLDAIAGMIGAANEDLADKISEKLVAPLSAKAEIEIAEQFEIASPFVAQRVADKLESVIAEKLSSAIKGVQLQNTQNLGTMVSAIYKTHQTGFSKLNDLEQRLACAEGYLITNSDKASLMHGKLVDMQGEALEHYTNLLQGQEEMARQASIHDAANGDRMLSIVDRFRQLEAVTEHRYMMTQAKLNAMFNSLSSQLNDLRPKTREQYRTNPSLEWFMDNLDEIVRVAEIVELVRKNHIPSDKSSYELTKAIRKLHLYSIQDVKPEVDNKIRSWERTQDFCEAA